MFGKFPAAGLLAVTLAVAATTANAAVLNLYSDQNCQDAAGQRNVYDNTCAETGGFQSYIITTAGGMGQEVTTYSQNACAGDQTTCNSAQSVNVCYPSFNSAGGSNAISSSSGCGIA